MRQGSEDKYQRNAPSVVIVPHTLFYNNVCKGVGPFTGNFPGQITPQPPLCVLCLPLVYKKVLVSQIFPELQRADLNRYYLEK